MGWWCKLPCSGVRVSPSKGEILLEPHGDPRAVWVFAGQLLLANRGYLEVHPGPRVALVLLRLCFWGRRVCVIGRVFDSLESRNGTQSTTVTEPVQSEIQFLMPS